MSERAREGAAEAGHRVRPPLLLPPLLLLLLPPLLLLLLTRRSPLKLELELEVPDSLEPTELDVLHLSASGVLHWSASAPRPSLAHTLNSAWPSDPACPSPTCHHSWP